jgi:HAD superfamily hydrolase (TIGR01509 family)
MPYKAAIFDVDGTLVDSVDLHAEAWRLAFEHFGKILPFETVRSQIGKGGDQLMPVFLSKSELDRMGDALTEYRSQIWKRDFISQVRAFPGVRPLFERLRQNGKKIALASSAKEDELSIYEKIADIGDLIDARATADDAQRSKPYPDIFQAALARLTSAPAETLAVGDTPYDAEAAVKAGIVTLGVLSGGFPEADLRRAGCREIHRDVADLSRHYNASLIGQGQGAQTS